MIPLVRPTFFRLAKENLPPASWHIRKDIATERVNAYRAKLVRQTDDGRYEQRNHRSPINSSKSSSIGGRPYSLIS